MIETKWGELKSALLQDGHEAVKEFTGQSFAAKTSAKDLNQKLDAAWLLMPWERLEKYYAKYGINLI